MITLALTSPTKQPATSDYSDEWHTVLAEAHGGGLVDNATFQHLNGNYAVGLIHGPDYINKVRDAIANGPAPEMGLAALDTFYLPKDVIELRAIDTAGGGAVSYCGVIGNPAQRAKMVAFIRKYYGLRNIFIGINPRRADMAGTNLTANADDIVARLAIVFDFDFKDASAAGDPEWTRTIAAMTCEMCALRVETGNGVHIWKDWEDGVDTNVKVIESAQSAKWMMQRLGADDLSDPPRIARLPFTVNLPTAAKRKRGATIKLAVPSKGEGE